MTVRLEIVEIWGWYEWQVRAASGRICRWSGPQSLRTETEAREHCDRVGALQSLQVTTPGHKRRGKPPTSPQLALWAT